jgi:endonuclease III
MSAHRDVIDRLLDRAGQTYCEQAGFTLRDRPSPLWQLVVLATVLAKPIGADLAVSAAAELRRAGATTPRRTLELTWQQRVDALVRAHYRRFDESTATRLAESARVVLDRWHGDLRRLAEDSRHDPGKARTLLQELPGIGPAGADIVLREAQEVWTWARPYLDERALDGAARVGLPTDATELAGLVPGPNLARLAAALVRITLDDDLAAAVREG